VAALRRKFVANPRADLAREAAELKVVLRNGKVLEARVERCIGSAGVPIPDEQLTRKTRGQLESAYAPEVAARILEQAWAMPQAPRAAAICADLRQVN
jgi:hypothetical protein